MNAPSPWLRPLQLLAVVLGAAIIALAVTWLLERPAGATPLAGSRTGEAAAPAVPRTTGDRGTDIAQPGASARTPNRTAEPREVAAPRQALAVLYGAVQHAGGAPVERGVLWLHRDGKLAATTRAKDGVYATAGLRPGKYSLRSRIDDELPLDREIDVAAPSTRVDIELAARWLLTVNAVTPAGKPLLPEVRARTRNRFRSRIAARAFETRLGGDLPLSNHAEVKVGLGTFRSNNVFRRFDRRALPKQTVGILTLPPGRAVHVALLLRNHLVAQQRVAPGQEEVTFTLAADALLANLATVRVRVVDRGGAPVAKARVALNDAQTGGGGLQTGADGRVTLQHLTPGRLDLEIWHRKLRAPPVQVDVAPGADMDLGDVVLLPGTLVEFAMDNFGGKGSVRFNWLGTPPDGMVVDDGHIISENGHSRKFALYPGRYGMLASAPNGVAIVELDLRTAPSTPIRFDLRPGAPLRIDSRVGTGIVMLELRGRSGVLVRRGELTGSRSETVQLPPGEYAALITGADGAPTRRTITLPRAGATIVIP